MAKKKKTTKKPAQQVLVQQAPPVVPDVPDYQELLEARRAQDAAHSAVRQAERELRSAESINTRSHREVAVAAAREKLNTSRQDASDAALLFTQLQLKARKNA